ncbi:hypothetical protein JCM21900_004437 [Sporobolomyces salmonicolor]
MPKRSNLLVVVLIVSVGLLYGRICRSFSAAYAATPSSLYLSHQRVFRRSNGLAHTVNQAHSTVEEGIRGLGGQAGERAEESCDGWSRTLDYCVASLDEEAGFDCFCSSTALQRMEVCGAALAPASRAQLSSLSAACPDDPTPVLPPAQQGHEPAKAPPPQQADRDNAIRQQQKVLKHRRAGRTRHRKA